MGGRLIVNETASLGGGLNVNTGALELRGHSALSSGVFSSSSGAIELVASDTPSTFDGRVVVHANAPTVQGRLVFRSEGDAATELTLDGAFVDLQQLSVRADGGVNDLLQPLTVRSTTGAELGTALLTARVNQAGITADFDEAIALTVTNDVDCNFGLDRPVTFGGRLTLKDSGYYIFSFPNVGELVVDAWTDLIFDDELFFRGADVGNVMVAPTGVLGSYNYGNLSSGDDHVIGGDVVVFGDLFTGTVGLIVTGDIEVNTPWFFAINRLEANSLRYRYGRTRSPQTVTLRDALIVEEGAFLEHACGTIQQSAGSPGFRFDMGEQSLWQVDLTEGAPVTFAAGSTTTVLHGMSFEAPDGTFISSDPGATFALDARGDLRVAAATYADAVGVGPGYVASAGIEVSNSVNIVAPPTCGDGTLDDGEECDDGNGDPADGCSAVCTVEPFFSCAGGTCVQVADECGDGIVGPTEACDPGSECQQSGETCTTDEDCLPFGGGPCVVTGGFFSDCQSDCQLNPQGQGIECFGCPSICFSDNPFGE